MSGEHSGNGALVSDDHDRVVRLEAAVDDIRKDVGESSSEGIRGKLDDHIKTCGLRWEDLALGLKEFHGELKEFRGKLEGMGRMFLWAAAAVGFGVSLFTTIIIAIVGWWLFKH